MAKKNYDELVENMEWYAMVLDFNFKSHDKPRQFNIFHGVRFHEGVVQILKKKGMTFEEFQKEVRSLAMYCYWGKCEYEMIVSPWPNCREYSANLTNTGMVIQKPNYTIDEDIRLEVKNPEVFVMSKMKEGRYTLQHNDDCAESKIDVFMQLEPNLARLTEYIIKESGYRVKKEEE